MKLIVSAPPFVKRGITTATIQRAVVAALAPSVVVAVYVLGFRALAVFGVSIGSAVAAEIVIRLISGRDLRRMDGGAVITGILLALLLPYTVPLWIPMVGAIFAIAIVKEAFGGSGNNIFNPALAGWIFIMMAWAVHTSTIPGLVYPHPLINYNAVRLAETSPVAIMVPPLFLMIIKYIDWRAPFSYLVSTLIFLLLFKQDMAFVVTGIYTLAVFLFVSDPVTTPVTKKGRLLFGTGCGLLTVLYANYANFVEGIGLSILLMNAITPLLDRFTMPKPKVAENLYEDLR